MTLRSPVPWLIAVLIVLLAGGAFSGVATSRAQAAAQARLSAQIEWDALEAMMSEQMTRATHGSAPFETDGAGAQERRVVERQQALGAVAPHAEQDIARFVDLLLETTAEDAAREGEISRLIIDTRSAVLGPLRERAEAWQRFSTWSLAVTGVLAVAGTAVALWRVGR